MTKLEEIARAIDPLPFTNWQNLYNFCLSQGDGEESAKHYADATHGPDIVKAREKARAALEAMREATPEMVAAGLTTSGRYGATAMANIWTTMITAALGPLVADGAAG